MKLLLSRFVSDPSHEYASIINNQKQLETEHSHDYFEIFIVNHGHAVHRTNGISRSLPERTIVLIRPEDFHSYRQMSPNFEIINVLIPTQTMQSLLDYLGEDFEPSRLLGPEVPPANQLPPNEFEMIIVQLEQLVLARHLRPGHSDANFRFTLLNVLFNCFPPTAQTNTPDIPLWLHGLCLEMMKKRNFTEGLPALRRLANKSNEHLSRTFKRYLKKSPTEFINDLRLDYSSRIIISTTTKIVDICGDAGFESLSHYYHLFQKRYGMSPNELRRRVGRHETPEPILSKPVLETSFSKGIPLD